MPTGSGISGQFGVAAETTWGTAVTVTRFYELLGESIQMVPARVESEGIRSGQRVLRSDDWVAGTKKVSGSLELELASKNMALLFEHALGARATTGTGPFTHTLTPGDLTGKGLTMQSGRPDVGGTVRPYTWNGCKIAGWSVGFALDEIAKLSLDVVGKDETTAIALASASYTSGLALLAYTHASVTLTGLTRVISGTISGTNPLASERFAADGTNTIAQPIENGRREYTFELECEFEDLVAVDRVRNGTEASLSVAFTRGADSITIAGNARFDSPTGPNLDDLDILTYTLSGKFVATAADSTAMTVTVVSSESTP